MKNFQIQIRVRFKEGILDPQSQAIEAALQKLQFKSVEKVACDKLFMIDLKAEDEGQAVQLGRQMANQLLANVVMENFEVELVSA
ncbi:MAG: phosphoribosylformylglycinamidine synthase subunit PurS [Deltaproteobacteria bacterium]|nr:phosphoribosylformylglycinamidine synthase subunit PurS [Deltaproteobacteria bacterium]